MNNELRLVYLENKREERKKFLCSEKNVGFFRVERAKNTSEVETWANPQDEECYMHKVK